MVKYDLREQGFSVEEKITNKSLIALLWLFFTVSMISFAFFIIFTIGNYLVKDSGEGLISFRMDPGSVPLYLFEFIYFVLLYFALKFLFTFRFCSDKYNSIKIKFLEDNNFPVCHCREALTVKQIFIIYFVPAAVVYSAMFFLSVAIGGGLFQDVEAGFITMLFFMSFFMGFDMALVVCVLFYKIKNKNDYISVDQHAYKMTVYKSTFVKTGKKTVKPEDRSQKHMFTKIKTCLNPECENYAQKLKKDIKTCPMCGGRTYISELMEDVLTCMNANCENHGQELKKETKICELCSSNTRPLAFDFNHRLKFPSIITSLTTTLVFMAVILYLDNQGIEGILVSVINWIKTAILLAGIVMGFLSKSRAAFVIALISLPASTMITFYILYFFNS